MRTRTLGAVLLVVVCMCGCKERKNAVLILNEQWSVNQAVSDCETLSRQEGPKCTADPRIAIRDSDAELANAFETEPACSGLTLMTLNVSEHQRPLNSRRNWWLFLELSPIAASDERRFTVSRSDDPSAPGAVRGQGTMKVIAKNACDFISGRRSGL
ncbi:MAG: hypothetical protein WCC87_06190 [Candidatus Korobacteraceae bacterium]